MKTTNLRWIARNMDYLRVPLNGTERAEMPGSIPYWGANGIVDYVNDSVLVERVILIGEDGAPFFERDKDVAFISEGAAWINNHIHILKPDERIIDDRFLKYFLNQVDYSLYINGSTRDKLTQSQLGNISVSYPDLATQRQIADFLDRETARIDLLIEKKQRLVALLGEKARSVINQATTIGFDSCDTQDSGEKWLGAVAAHWRVTPLKWFTRLQSGYAFKADRFGDVGTRLVRMNNLKRGALDLEEAVCIADEDVNLSVMLRAGDILLGMSGSIGETGSLGNFAVVAEEDLPCLLNQRVGRFQFVGDELLPDYLKLAIQSASFLDPIFLAATSTAQFNVSPSQVGAIMFALPPVTEQKEIGYCQVVRLT